MSTITFRLPATDDQYSALPPELQALASEAAGRACCDCGHVMEPGQQVAIEGAYLRHLDCRLPSTGQEAAFEVSPTDPFDGPHSKALRAITTYAQTACSAYDLMSLSDKELLSLHIDAWEVASDASTTFGVDRHDAHELFWRVVERVSSLTRQNIVDACQAA